MTTTPMRIYTKLFPALALLLVAASGCREAAEMAGMAEDPGFDKVATRVREDLDRPAAPNPPPVVAGIGGGGGGAVPQLAANVTPAGVTQAMVEEGAQQYGTVCSACHGSAGAGSGAAPALNDQEWLHISGQYEEIVTIINNGVASPKQFAGAMPPRGGGQFNDEQVRAIAAYVFALSHQGS